MEADGWLGVELRHLAALEAVASTGSFGRAATKLGYTQSAVSQQIATLERIVGELLVDRPGGPRPVTMTEAGRVLLRHAESIVGRLKAAQADLAALSAGEAGSLHVGIFQSAGAKLLPEIMRPFAAAWPNVDVEFFESHSDTQLGERVERGELDVAFVQLPLDLPSLETFELLRDEYVLVTAADSPFARSPKTPSLREIADQPLIGYRNCRATDLVADQMRAAGCEPHFVFRSDENGAVQGLASAGIGVAVMPSLAVDRNDDSVSIVSLGSRMAPRIIGLARHRDRHHSAAARAFLELSLELGRGSSVEAAA